MITSTRKEIFLLLLSLVSASVIIGSFWKWPFYGFEYEDSFINTSIAIEESPLCFGERYRASVHTERENGSCDRIESFSGHYVTYGLYLKLVKRIFNIHSAHLIHKTGNIVLLCTSLVLSFLICKPKKRVILLGTVIITLGLLPVAYVLNSGLKENLSFAIGLILIAATTNPRKRVVTIVILVLVLTIIKRENLIYAIVPIIVIPRDIWSKMRFVIPVIFMILIQVFINPFYTEGLESQDIGQHTFSLSFATYQLPTYLISTVHYSGFLAITLLAFTVGLSKTSWCLLAVWILLILTYSLHYRSQSSIDLKQIAIFDTFRYLVNSLPLFLGVLIHSKNKYSINPNLKLIAVLTIVIPTYSYSMIKLKSFVQDEEYNYHYSSSLIVNSYKKCTILDSHPLISKLDQANNVNADIRTLESRVLHMDLKEPIVILNRFNAIDLDKILEPGDTAIELDAEYLYLLKRR